MPKVILPSASWDTVLACLEDLESRGYLVTAVRREIEDQLFRQEN